MTDKIDATVVPEAVRRATSAVLNVGDGRGFVIEGRHERRYMVTAAHCLPSQPPAHAGSYTQERTYAELLGGIGEEQTAWAECLFVNPIADIAVLCAPDGQELPEEWEAYETLVGETEPLRIGDINGSTTAWLLGLDGTWSPCVAKLLGRGGIWLSEATAGLRPGMSGSPVLTSEGRVTGVFSLSGATQGEVHTRGGPQASLVQQLPLWLLHETCASELPQLITEQA